MNIARKMLPFLLLTGLLVFGLKDLRAQAIGLQEIRNIGDVWADRVDASVQDNHGNVIILGTFYLTADFDPGPGVTNLNATTNGRIFLLKLDAQGQFVWAKNFGNNGDTKGEDLAVDDFGNIYVTGQLRFTSDFDPGPNSFNITNSGNSNARDCFVAKYDSSGNFIWVKSYGNNDGQVIGSSLEVSHDNQGLYLAGRYTFTTDFDPSPAIDTLSTPGFSTSGYIQHLDTAGNHLWVKPFQSTQITGLAAIDELALDSLDNIYLMGDYFGSIDFDPGTGTSIKTSAGSGGLDMHIGKFDSTGSLLWHHSIGSANNYDNAMDMYLQDNGGILVTGGFGTTVDFDPGPDTLELTTNGLGDIFILRLFNNGNLDFARSMGGIGNDLGYRIIADDFDNIFTVGNFRNTVDFDPGSGTYQLTANPNTWSMFTSKFDSAGNFRWTESADGSFLIAPRGIHFITDEILIVGEVDSVYDFDPSPAVVNNGNNGDDDIFIYRVKECTADTTNLLVTACDSFFFNGLARTLSGTYVDTLRNSFNCDSVIVLDLIINNSSGFAFSDTACGSYLFAGQQLTSGGIYYDTLANQSGCDSLISLNLTLYQSTAVSLALSACDSLEFNGSTLTMSGTYSDTLATINGCDSIVNLSLTINQSSQFAFADTACYLYDFNNQILTNGGVYIDTLSTVEGCDSIVTLNLSLNGLPITLINDTACSSYLFDGQYLTSSGTYYDTLASSGTCDSIVQLNLVINTVNTNVNQNATILTAQETGADYQWIDCATNAIIPGETSRSFNVTQNGAYAVVITKNNCEDTSACFSFTDIDLNESELGQIKVYPNPVNDVLSISAIGLPRGQIDFDIVGTSGSIVLSGKLTKTEEELDLGRFAPGVYYIIFRSGDFRGIARRIIKK
jgi:hypothetical protein